MNSPLTLPCPAKLNLFLLITGQLPSGYHTLQTLFQLLDFGDQLTIRAHRRNDVTLSGSCSGIPPGQNLVTRAARLLKTYTGYHGGADLHLEKHLPQGGGLGGGSSDAASTLVGLNHVWQTGLTLDQLANLGLQLGADIPVFVHGHSALATGIGEELTPIALDENWYVVLAPNCEVSTALVFSHKDLTRNSIAIKVRAFFEEGGRNDCQPLVERLYPEVKEAVDWLSRFGPARLTGTGGCVFAAFSSEQAARDVFARRPEPFRGFVARGVNQSPLHQRLL